MVTATRTLEDITPKPLALLRKVQAHKGWGDGVALKWLDDEVCGWQTAIGNAGNWIIGADPTLHLAYTGPYHEDQILTGDEARMLRRWHSHPWQVMYRPAWERWTRSLWRIPTRVTLHPPPEISDQLRALDIIWPVEWWPHAGKSFQAAPIKNGWGRVDFHELEHLLARMNGGEQGYGPDVTALALSPHGVFRLLRNAFQDWYEGQWREDR